MDGHENVSASVGLLINTNCSRPPRMFDVKRWYRTPQESSIEHVKTRRQLRSGQHLQYCIEHSCGRSGFPRSVSFGVSIPPLAKSYISYSSSSRAFTCIGRGSRRLFCRVWVCSFHGQIMHQHSFPGIWDSTTHSSTLVVYKLFLSTSITLRLSVEQSVLPTSCAFLVPPYPYLHTDVSSPRTKK